jgi:hypothetical protein
MISEEEKEMYDALDAYYDKLESDWKQAKEQVKDLIEPKYFVFAESNDTYESYGIVEIEETEEKRNGYPNHRCCRVKNVKDYNLYMHTTNEVETYNDDSPYEGEPVEYWVWQTTGYLGDDYSGYLLLPLKDGRYWKIGYSC